MCKRGTGRRGDGCGVPRWPWVQQGYRRGATSKEGVSRPPQRDLVQLWWSMIRSGECETWWDELEW